MKKNNVRKYIIYISICISVILTYTQCSPQKRLNRLIANNPELAKTDTVYSTRTATLPGYKLDTTFNASQNVNGLSGIIDNYKDYIDSISRLKLGTEIKNYIVQRSCLDDTITITLKRNGWCKLWQSKGVFFYTIYQPDYKYQFTVPVSVQKFEVTTSNNWKMFWIGAFSSIMFLVLLYLIGMWTKPKIN